MKRFIVLVWIMILTWNTSAFGQNWSSILLETNEIANGYVNYNHSQYANNPLQRRAEDFEGWLVSECHDLKQIYDQSGVIFPLTNSLSGHRKIERTKYRIGSMTKKEMAWYERNCKQEVEMMKLHIIAVAPNANIPGGNFNPAGGVVGGRAGIGQPQQIIPGDAKNARILAKSEDENAANERLNNLRAQQWRAARDLEDTERNLRNAENKRFGMNNDFIKKSPQEMQTDIHNFRNDADDARGRLNRVIQDINNLQ